MNSIGEACSLLSKYLLTFAGSREWDSLCVCFTIYPKMTTARQRLILRDEESEIGDFAADPSAIWDGITAAEFIRDVKLAAGRRIWGLTFTLYPDGKYHIEYDYQKPADYEDDPEDTIDGDEINQRLQQLQATTPAMPAEQAYQQIGYCLLQALGEGWQQASIDIDYRPGRQVMMHFWQHDAHGRQQAPQVPPQASMVDAANAAYALLDNLLAQGGQAPQGLTLHLDADGKMQLHYHYAS